MVLVGLMGSGKTTVGRALAGVLDRPFVDLDDEITAAAERSIPEIFEAEGEGGFRELERQRLLATLARTDDPVIAAGGGVVVRQDNRAALRSLAGTVVWLRASPATATRRTAGEPGTRPLLADDPAATLERLHDERAAWYAEVADVTVDVDALDPDAAVSAVRRALADPGTGS